MRVSEIRIALRRVFSRVADRTAQLAVCVLFAVLSGCAGVPPMEAPPPPDEEPAPTPEEPEVDAEPPTLPPPPEPALPRQPEPPLKAAIVMSDRSPAFEGVAAALAGRLELPLLYNLADRSLSAEEAFAGIAESDVDVVVAIGLPATQAAASHSTVPVVYSQVFNLTKRSGSGEKGVPLKGVSMIPPLALQLRSWKEIDPGLRSVGAIVGSGHEPLIREAAQAAAAHGLEFHYRIAASDREALYLFRRLSSSIDGFWLFPDNRILSVPILQQMLEVARRHQVKVAVFSHSLLGIGAALSTASIEDDIADRILAVAGQLAAGLVEPVPDMTPLSQLSVRTGAAVDEAGGSLVTGGTGAGETGRERL